MGMPTDAHPALTARPTSTTPVLELAALARECLAFGDRTGAYDALTVIAAHDNIMAAERFAGTSDDAFAREAAVSACIALGVTFR
jgi:hypothetical protein